MFTGLTGRFLSAISILALTILVAGLVVHPAQAQQSENTVVCDEAVDPTAISYGDNTSGCAIDVATDLDRFTFQGAAGTSIQINARSTSGSVDPVLEVRDPSGVVLVNQSCDTGGTGCWLKVDLDLTLSGTYQIAVSDLRLDNIGNYQISLNCFVGSCPGAPALPKVAYDVPVVDTITPQVDMDFFTFQGAAGTSIRINARSTSGSVDPVLEFRDPNGDVPIVPQVCDTGGTGCSLQVNMDLTLSGTYQMAVSDLRLDNIGNYQISLLCIFGDCPAEVVGDDFNGDSLSDILWRNTSTARAVVWQMDGFIKTSVGGIGAPPLVWQVVDLGDFTGEGKADILWRNTSTGNVVAWEMDGFVKASAGGIGAVPLVWQVAGLGDFNGDEMSDLLWRNTTTGSNIIWQMNGLARDTAGSIPRVPTVWQVAGVDDFDGDGKADILWRNTSSGNSIVWLMNGTTTLAAQLIGVPSLVWQVAGTGDFNGDLKADILWRNTTTGAALVWQMSGFVKVSTASIGTLSSDWQIVRLGDYNGDGKADILWRNTATGRSIIWQMNGLAKDAVGGIGVVPLVWEVQ